jgi:divalent metal cation (Fe/Co/Zn/Cd) transporter
MRHVVTGDPAVDRVGKLLTMQIGHSEELLNIEIEFHPQGSIDELDRTIDRIERRIRDQNRSVQQVFLEAASRLAAAPRSWVSAPLPDWPDY